MEKDEIPSPPPIHAYTKYFFKNELKKPSSKKSSEYTWLWILLLQQLSLREPIEPAIIFHFRHSHDNGQVIEANALFSPMHFSLAATNPAVAAVGA